MPSIHQFTSPNSKLKCLHLRPGSKKKKPAKLFVYSVLRVHKLFGVYVEWNMLLWPPKVTHKNIVDVCKPLILICRLFDTIYKLDRHRCGFVFRRCAYKRKRSVNVCLILFHEELNQYISIMFGGAIWNWTLVSN